MDINANIITQNIKQEERYLIALVESKKIAFSARWIQDILVFTRSQVLELPFYSQSLLGVLHHQNQIIPLVSGHHIFSEQTSHISQTTLTALRLNQLGKKLAGVGVVVDRMVQSISHSELGKEKLFQLTDIPQSIWLPQR